MIKPTLGNIVIIGATALVFIGAAAATIHYLAPKNVPVLSPTARGVSDFWTKAVAA